LDKLPHIDFIQGYGQTEMAPVITVLAPEYHVTSGPKSGKLRSAGQPAMGCEVKIANEDGTICPSGEVGEIWCRSPGSMLGYWQLPEQTADTLQDGWVKTGDGAYQDEDGFIFIVDRIKDMIVSGGENVFSSEVESAISTHADVAEVAVVGIPSEEWGEAVHAIIVPRDGAEPSLESVVEHCQTSIAKYKCPRSIELRSEPLPLSGAGKVLKKDLRAPYWESAGRNVN